MTPSVEFLAGLPDDALYDDDGYELQFAGRNVAEAIAAALTAGGYVVSEPENCQELGWELEARRGGCRFWMRVTKIAEFVVATQDMTFRLWPKRPSYIEFRRELHSALASDPRFTEIRWFDDVLPTDGGDWSAEPA